DDHCSHKIVTEIISPTHSSETEGESNASDVALNVTPPTAQRYAMLLFWFTAALVIVLDQCAKIWIRSTLPLGADMPVWTGWMHFTHTLNFGAAWGVLSGHRWLLIIVSIAVVIFILLLSR